MESVYRGDSRRPEDLFAQGGFKAWQPLTIAEAVDLILLYTGMKTLQDCCFGKKVERGLITLESDDVNAIRTPLDLSQLIIRSKQRGPSLSTEPTEGCGGYSSGYIYKIDCSAMEPIEWDKAVPGMKVPKNAGWWPTLCLDKGTDIRSTSSIAIKSKSQKGGVEEVTFFNSIAPERTVLHKKPVKEAVKTKLSIGDALTKVVLETKKDSMPKPSARWAHAVESSIAPVKKETPKGAPMKVSVPKVVTPPPMVKAPEPVITTGGMSIKDRIKKGGFQ